MLWQDGVEVAPPAQSEVPAAATAHKFAQLTTEVNEDTNTAVAARRLKARRARGKFLKLHS
ncbi:MAG TPA: hypothetical protein VMT20_08420 [Terriglobia bacterium]|nr:hypothetical protein [Terriglobia bacterium]